MGTEYELFDHSKKEYIGLGKQKPFHGKPGAYQMPAERIKAFCRGRGPLQMLSDSGNQPCDDDDAWRCLGRWWWEDEEYRLFFEGLMSRDGLDRAVVPGGGK